MCVTNQPNSALLVGEITQPLQPLGVCENSSRLAGYREEWEMVGSCFSVEERMVAAYLLALVNSMLTQVLHSTSSLNL